MSALAIPSQPEYRALMMFDTLPEGCVAFLCSDGYSLPHVRPGEFVVVDTNDRTPRDCEVYVIQWQSGRRVICQAHNTRRKTIQRPAEEAWSVGSLKAIRGRAAIEAYIEQASQAAIATGDIPTLRGLGWSEGWFTAEHLESKLVGCVIGIYAPAFEEPKRIVGRAA